MLFRSERERERERIILRIIYISYCSNVYDKFCFVGKSQISGHLFNNVFTTKKLQPFGVIGNVSPESPQFHNFYDKKTMIVSYIFWHSANFNMLHECTMIAAAIPDETASIHLCHCSATHPSRTAKPKIRILGIVVREGCVALHYSVHFFLRFFSLSRNDHNRGGDSRCKICTVPTPLLCLPDPLEKM